MQVWFPSHRILRSVVRSKVISIYNTAWSLEWCKHLMFWESFLVYEVVSSYLHGSSSDVSDKHQGLPLLLHEALSGCSALAPSHWCQHLAFVSLSLVAPVKLRTYCTPIQPEDSIKWKPCKLFVWLLLHLMNMFSLLFFSINLDFSFFVRFLHISFKWICYVSIFLNQ